ncbi:hypothetical protein DPEC_G00019620 [Dallia pectoralis]|uniref:Uncharacterized protein n=1 Tax=Dallia pectoralis TaxID=75939 RepID=A0ACC2HGD4_DALPE|nr:hypothetical protein DPEC_G00019620 [Dallia pectoralis]
MQKTALSQQYKWRTVAPLGGKNGEELRTGRAEAAYHNIAVRRQNKLTSNSAPAMFNLSCDRMTRQPEDEVKMDCV